MMAKRLLAHPKVTVMWNSAPVECKGDGDLLQSIAVKNTKTGELSDLKVNGLFYAIGSFFFFFPFSFFGVEIGLIDDDV